MNAIFVKKREKWKIRQILHKLRHSNFATKNKVHQCAFEWEEWKVKGSSEDGRGSYFHFWWMKFLHHRLTMPQDFHLCVYGLVPLAINLNPYTHDIVAGRSYFPFFFDFSLLCFLYLFQAFSFGMWWYLNEK